MGSSLKSKAPVRTSFSVNTVIENEEYIEKFTPEAKKQLSEQANQYANDLAKKAYHIASLTKQNHVPTEVTSDAVAQAVQKKNFSNKPKWYIIVQVFHAAFTYFSGLVFNTDKMQESTGYMIFAIIMIAASLIFTFIVCILDN